MYYDNKKLALNIILVILGALLIGLSVMEVIDPSFFSGMGGALIGVGVVRMITIRRYRKDPEYREKTDIKASDERNTYLRMKSWAWTGYIVILAEGVAVIAARIAGRNEFSQMCAYSLCLMLVIYLIVYMVLSRRY